MKTKELLIVAVVHLLAFTIAAFVINLFQVGDPGLALVVGACGGSCVAGVLYHRREQDSAPFPVKAAAGGVLSTMAIITGLASQGLLKWMTYPGVVIPIAVIGSFAFPWAMFGSMQKAFATKQPDGKLAKD